MMWSRIASLWAKVPLDKKAHFLAGAVVALVAMRFFHDYWSCLALAGIAGVLKEGFDLKTGGEFDPWDFISTLLGGMVFGVFTWL